MVDFEKDENDLQVSKPNSAASMSDSGNHITGIKPELPMIKFPLLHTVFFHC